MAYDMRGEKLHRNVQCSMNMCRSRDTFVFYRGRDFGQTPLHLCRDCIRGILTEYIRLDGVEAASALLGDVAASIVPAQEEVLQEEAVQEDVTADEPAEPKEKPSGRRRKAAAE